MSAEIPDRRSLLGRCRWEAESSEPVRCRLRGLRVEVPTFTFGENMLRGKYVSFDQSFSASVWQHDARFQSRLRWVK